MPTLAAERRVITAATVTSAVVIATVWWLAPPSDTPPDPAGACRTAVARELGEVRWLHREVLVRHGVNVTVDGTADTGSGEVTYRCVVGRDGQVAVVHVG